MGKLHEQIHQLYELPLKKTKVQESILRLSEICETLTVALGQYHEDGMAVCIHYVNQREGDLHYVTELTRNTRSKTRSSRWLPRHQAVDYIKDNSDFNYLSCNSEDLSPDEFYYLRNFLPWLPFYRNSHFSKKMVSRYYGFGGWLFRLFSWELPYKSTLVVPIYIDDKIQRQIIGFISADSPRMWAFSAEYDVPMLRQFASSISHFVKSYYQLNLLHQDK